MKRQTRSRSPASSLQEMPMETALRNGAQAESAAAALPTPEDPAMVPRRILIVEDNDAAREQLQKLLRLDPNLRVDATANGKDALAKLSQGNYSILITDLRMPSYDGMDLIREIQERRLPVTTIVVTGHG